ncbi:osteocalcin-like [Pseudophryne corroboree]|uniref:osteocalcin-like n=1 Tax=Pseudophryne corroboree TaxID=495146 RepID=UPI003081F8C3
MKTLIVLGLLGMMACCLAQEGDPKSRKLLNTHEVKMSRNSANSVIKRHRRSYDYFERFFQRMKSPLELKKEQCENYWPCDQLSEWVGFHQAYRRYFGSV